MPKYLVRRGVPAIGSMSADQLHDLSAKSNAALAQVGPGAQWVQSYVTRNTLFCVYNAESEEKIREHARIGGFPCDEITQITGVIDPVTGEN